MQILKFNRSQKMSTRQKPTGWIKLQNELVHPEVQQLLSLLCRGGIDSRFVGGCVRDCLLKKPIKDIDIGTPLLPEQVIDLLNRYKVKTLTKGIEYGTVTAILPHFKIDITTLRKDVETDGRRAVVSYTDNWHEDAKRRDFTFNALSCNLRGELYDPFMGIADLRAGRVRFIGKAEDRILEDNLRMLRYFRFYAHYGFPPVDKDGRRAIIKHKELLKTLSKERIRDEFLHLLSALDPVPTLRYMLENGILQQIIPEVTDINVLERLIAFEAQYGEIKPLRRLIALAPEKQDFMEAFALSAAIDKKIKLLQKPKKEKLLQDPAEINLYLYYYSVETVRDILFLHAALNHGSVTDLCASLIQTRFWKPVTFPVTGEDLKAHGLTEGTELGQALKELERWWIRDGFRANREECLSYFASTQTKAGGKKSK